MIVKGITVFFMRGSEKYGIDFTGGTVVQVKFDDKVKIEELRNMLKQVGLEKSTIQYFGIDKTTVIIKTNLQEVNNVQQIIKENLEGKKFSIERVEQIGPAIGKELRTSAIIAFTMASLGHILYIPWRFEFKFAIAAIVALIHDVLVTAGSIAVFGYFTGKVILDNGKEVKINKLLGFAEKVMNRW